MKQFQGFENHATNVWDGYENELKKVEGYHRQIDGLLEEAKKAGETMQVMRYLCQHDLYFLLVYVIDRKDIEFIVEKETGKPMHRPWLFERCMEINSNRDGYLDIWARDHYKSTLISYGLTIQEVLLNPEISICIYAYNVGLARKLMNQVKQTLETNRLLYELFPDILFSSYTADTWEDGNGMRHAMKWSNDAIQVKRRGGQKEATIECSGLVEGMKTGGHYNLLIYDDTVTLDSVRTAEQVKKTTEAWSMSINTASSNDIRIRMIGTRYSLYDTYYDILKQGVVKLRCYPCYFDGTEEPVLYSREMMEFKRQNSTYGVFETQMLCNPQKNSIWRFDPDWIPEREAFQPYGMNIYILCDPAGSQKASSDYSAFIAVGLDWNQRYCILDVIRDRLNLEQKWNAVRSLVTRFTYQKDGVSKKPVVFYEQVSMQSDLQFFNIQMKQTGSFFQILPVSSKPKLNPDHQMAGRPKKEQRIGALVPLFKNRRIWLPPACRHVNYSGADEDMLASFMEQEYLSYPHAKHDDVLDSLSRIADLEAGIMMVFPDRPQPRKERQAGSYEVSATAGYVPY